ncbi:MAG: site-specific integrase [Clostridia bacterium]|nr:site-specific integrase [Clostridia bacterium]
MFMDYCRSKQLRPKTMGSYEQTLKLFSRWLKEKYDIENAEEVKEPHIRAYIVDLQQRGKYTFCADRRSEDLNHPTSRRDYRQQISNITINNYLRNIRVFFTWLEESECILKSPLRRVKELPEERPAKEYLEDDEVIRLFKNMDTSYYTEYYQDKVKREDALIEFYIIKKTSKAMPAAYAYVKSWFLDKYKTEFDAYEKVLKTKEAERKAKEDAMAW